MVNLVKLTLVESGKQGQEIWINADQIVGMLPISGGTIITLTAPAPNCPSDVRQIIVRESPRTISNLG